MFTLFDLLQLVGALAGAVLGLVLGHERFGIVGAIIGTPLGLYLGNFVGQIPWLLTWKLMRRDLKRSPTEALRARVDENPFISHLAIAELVIRGEPVEDFRPAVVRQLQSSSPLVRHFGEANAKLWFPDLVKRDDQL
jgi:hypothetical protein